MLKSLRSDILHEAESKDLKVVIISGTYLISILRVLQYPADFPQNLWLTAALPHLQENCLEAPLQEH